MPEGGGGAPVQGFAAPCLTHFLGRRFLTESELTDDQRLEKQYDLLVMILRAKQLAPHTGMVVGVSVGEQVTIAPRPRRS